MLAGAVFASEGSLIVITRNRRIELRPEFDGTTKVVSSKKVDHPVGTRIEIKFGPKLPHDPDALQWARVAIDLASGGSSYPGKKTSPWWYDAPSFRELLDAGGDQPVHDLMMQFDGDVDKIVAKAGLNRTPCSKVKTRERAEKLLSTARSFTKPIDPALFGALGAEAFNGHDELGYPLLPSYDLMRAVAKIELPANPLRLRSMGRGGGRHGSDGLRQSYANHRQRRHISRREQDRDQWLQPSP